MLFVVIVEYKQQFVNLYLNGSLDLKIEMRHFRIVKDTQTEHRNS